MLFNTLIAVASASTTRTRPSTTPLPTETAAPSGLGIPIEAVPKVLSTVAVPRPTNVLAPLPSPTQASEAPSTSPKGVTVPGTVSRYAKGFNFMVIGDWGSKSKGQKRLANVMNTVGKYDSTAFVAGLGDNFYEFGVHNTQDKKFQTVWKHIYTDYLHTIPFYQILGNHDWYLNPKAQIEYSKLDSKWIMPDFFYTHEEKFGKSKAAFIYLDTDLFHYGYDCFHYECAMSYANFLKMGWTRHSKTMEKQYAWVESQLKRYQNYDYVFVLGHHQAAVCGPLGEMPRLQKLFEDYNVSAYFFGHRHSLGLKKSKNTMFVLSGAAGKKEHSCADDMWKAGDTYGFVQVHVDAQKFNVAFVDDKGALLHSQVGAPRVK